MRILKDDICRCHDDGCKEHERCMRWTQRNTGGPNLTHCESMFPYDIPLSEPCPNRIPTEEGRQNDEL